MTVNDYVRPHISDTLGIKAARHPIREKIMQTTFIPNDVYATQQSRFQIITGCNMSGKSTFIRMIALLSIMAQVGSFVPASSASFPILHNLFARIGMDDSIESNISTFSAEMREIAFILRNLERRSMAVVPVLVMGLPSLLLLPRPWSIVGLWCGSSLISRILRPFFQSETVWSVCIWPPR